MSENEPILYNIHYCSSKIDTVLALDAKHALSIALMKDKFRAKYDGFRFVIYYKKGDIELDKLDAGSDTDAVAILLRGIGFEAKPKRDDIE